MNHPLLIAAGISLASLILGCAPQKLHESHSQAKGSYVRDAEACWARNPQIEIEATASLSDQSDQRYLSCLSERGYQQKIATDPLLVAIRRCRSEGGAVFSASGETYQSRATSAMIEKCLVERGFTKPQIITSRLNPSSADKNSLSVPEQTADKVNAKDDVQTVIIPPR